MSIYVSEGALSLPPSLSTSFDCLQSSAVLRQSLQSNN